ncbi:MAG: hypothetical protein HYT78_09135 [Deltaproteobacteria bacterium]|nr:hypothetical protein [Deltaproteobacteria bacterium]
MAVMGPPTNIAARTAGLSELTTHERLDPTCPNTCVVTFQGGPPKDYIDMSCLRELDRSGFMGRVYQRGLCG